MIPCDGCGLKYDSGESLKYAAGLGHIVRYCVACFDEYRRMLTIIEKERDRVQKRLDAFELRTRRNSFLAVTPLDLPRLIFKDGQPVVLK